MLFSLWKFVLHWDVSPPKCTGYLVNTCWLVFMNTNELSSNNHWTTSSGRVHWQFSHIIVCHYQSPVVLITAICNWRSTPKFKKVTSILAINVFDLCQPSVKWISILLSADDKEFRREEVRRRIVGWLFQDVFRHIAIQLSIDSCPFSSSSLQTRFPAQTCHTAIKSTLTCKLFSGVKEKKLMSLLTLTCIFTRAYSILHPHDEMCAT